MMNLVLHRSLIVCLLAAALAAPNAALAQGGPPPPGGPGGFGGPPPPQFQAWQAWRASHPNIEAVSRTLRGVEEMELGPPGGFGPAAPPDPATQLNALQSRKMLAVLKNWSVKPVMTDAQAAQVNARLTSLLNPAQKAALAAHGSGFGDGRGGRRGGGGFGFGGGAGRVGGGGGGGFGGPRPGSFAIAAPRDYNPLNPSTSPMGMMRARGGHRFSELMARLAATGK